MLTGGLPDDNSSLTAAIVLAAGNSSRMGESKQLLRIGSESLLVRSVHAAIDAHAGPVIVVLGARFREHLQALGELPVNVVENPDWEKGMGSSIKAGVQQVLALHPHLQSILLTVCDQPQADSGYLRKIFSVGQQTSASAIASMYSSTVGVPAVFKRPLFQRLLDLNDGQGAKQVLLTSGCERVDFPEGAVDLDTREDYMNFIRR